MEISLFWTFCVYVLILWGLGPDGTQGAGGGGEEEYLYLYVCVFDIHVLTFICISDRKLKMKWLLSTYGYKFSSFDNRANGESSWLDWSIIGRDKLGDRIVS